MEKPRETRIRDLILTTASNIFKRFGFKKTTMEDIASSLNKAKGSLYYYFRNKEDIFRSIVEKEKNQLHKELESVLTADISPEKKLKEYFTKKILLLKKLPNYYSAFRDKHLEHYRFVSELRRNSKEDDIKSIKEILDEGEKANSFRKADYKKIAANISGAIKYLEERAMSGEDPKILKNDLNLMLDIMIYGLLKRD